MLFKRRSKYETSEALYQLFLGIVFDGFEWAPADSSNDQQIIKFKTWKLAEIGKQETVKQASERGGEEAFESAERSHKSCVFSLSSSGVVRAQEVLR